MNNLVQGEKSSNCNAASYGALIRLLFWQRKQQNSRVGTAVIVTKLTLDHSTFHFSIVGVPDRHLALSASNSRHYPILSLSLCTLGLIRSNRLLSNGVTSARRPCIPEQHGRGAEQRTLRRDIWETETATVQRTPQLVPPAKKQKKRRVCLLPWYFSLATCTERTSCCL